MDDNNVLYERHDGLGIIQQQHVAIIGCGGIGSWIALYLGLAGVTDIDIYDSDIISENNLNRFPLGPDSIGLNKAEAMAIHIQSLRRDINVIPRQNFEPEIHSDKLRQYRWVVVTTDSLKSRQMVHLEVLKCRKEHGVDSYPGYIECGADGHHATVTFSPATFATSEEEQPGYRSVPVFVGPCTLAASVAAYYVLLGSVKDYQRTIQATWGNGAGLPSDYDNLSLTTINEADEEIETVYDESASDVADALTELAGEADNEQAI